MFSLIQEIKDELEEAEVYKPRDTRKALDSYGEKRTQEFWSGLRASKGDGLGKGDIARIFNVGSSRSYTLLDSIHLDYDKVGLIPNKGNQPKKLVHKRVYLINLIRQDFDDLAGQISEKTGENIGSQNWETLLKIYTDEIKSREDSKAVNKSREKLNHLEEAKEVCGVEDTEYLSID